MPVRKRAAKKVVKIPAIRVTAVIINRAYDTYDTDSFTSREDAEQWAKEQVGLLDGDVHPDQLDVYIFPTAGNVYDVKSAAIELTLRK